jgi:lipoprotein-anchoring transpeptidase ErfK/SrfK
VAYGSPTPVTGSRTQKVNSNASASLHAPDREPGPFRQPQVAQDPVSPRTSWIDRLFLGGLALVAAGACGILALMAWQAPEVIRAAYRPTAAFTAIPAADLGPLHTPTPDATATATATAVPSSTATEAPPPTPTATRVLVVGPPQDVSPGHRWIDIDISEQRLAAYEGDTLVLSADVSTGLPGTPTPLGEFRIYRRVPIQAMGGPDYYLPNVQYVAYFDRDYAIHATYWHDNFGQPMSHGCVNMRTADARWLYEWAPLGTLVRVHE